MVKLWILHFIPDELLQKAILFLIFVGVSLYPIGFLTNFLPGGKKYKSIIFVIATLITIAGFYFEGSYSTEMAWRKKVEEVQAKVAVAEAQAAEANTKIKTRIIKRTKVIHDRQIIVRKELQQVEKQINSECKLDPIVNKIHNDAAKNPMSIEK